MNRKERRAAARSGRASGGAPADALPLLQDGLRRQEAGDIEGAAARYREALKLSPENPDALHLLGVIAHMKDDHATAIELIGQALRRAPDIGMYHNNMGAALRAAGRHGEAAEHYRRAIALDPADAAAYANLGNALDALGRTDEAMEAYRAALARDARCAEAHGGLAELLARSGDGVAALRHAEQAAAIAPSPRSLNNLGGALSAAGRTAEAEAAFRRAVAMDPRHGRGWINLGVLLRELDRPAEAEAALRRGLALLPEDGYGWETLGLALEDQGRLNEAEAALRRSIAADPRRPGAYNNLGLTLRRLERHEEAIRCFDDALAADPSFDHAAANRALALLAMGRFAEGWSDYRRRGSIASVRHRIEQNALPADLSNRRILVLRDQGLGDEIFFLRFLPRLKARGAWIAYQAQRPVAGMIARLAFIDRVVEEGRDGEPGDIDIVLSAGDLPWLTGMRSLSDLPPSVTLSPLPERVAEMRQRLAAFGPPPWIGLTWRAGVQQRNLLSKIAPPDALANALRGAHGTLVALQRAPAAGEIERFAGLAGRPVADLTALNDDLEGMLAVLSLLDDYVCVSNTNVHLRAACGRTSRVLVPFPPDYRWMDSGDESPWFPGCTVYRETRAADWSAAFARLAADLARG